MVKVQKPVPKSLAKTGNADNIKKKLGKPQKSKVAVVAEAVVAPAPKSKAAKMEKKKLIEKTIEEATIIAPVKKEKKKKVKIEETTIVAPAKKEKKKKEKIEAVVEVKAPLPVKEKVKKQKQKKVVEPKSEPPKRPLVIAPPESPIAVQSTPAIGKGKKNKKQKNVETKDAVPAVAPAVGKKQKKQKSKAAKLKVAESNDVPAKTKPTKSKTSSKEPKDMLTKMQKKKANKRAFKKQQIKNAKSTKPKKPLEQNLAPVPFDEDKFRAIVNVQNVKKIVEALKTQVEKEVAEKKTSIFSDYRYFLNVASFKIPNCPKRVVKLNVKHSLVDKEDDILMIVPDLQRGAKVEYDTTIQHWEDIFREAGIEGIKIMPFNQLRTECNTFEAVRKLANTYDYFLCDGRLVGHTAGFCGKVFQTARATFHAVRLENLKNLKHEVDKALLRTAYRQVAKGDLISIPVGNHKYNMQQLSENIDHVITQLRKLYPGGLGNVRSLYVKIDIKGTSSLPLYISMAQVPADTPYVVGTREERMHKLKKEANEVLTKFAMNKDAELVKLTKKQMDHKRKLTESRAVLLAESTAEPHSDDEGDESTVPAKKARKEKKANVKTDLKKKETKQQSAEPESDDDDEDDDADEDADEDADANEIDEDEDGDEDNSDDEDDDDEDDE